MSEWLPIAGYEGLYEITGNGGVRRAARNQYQKRENGKIFIRGILPAKELKLMGGNRGYLVVELAKNKQRKLFLFHRLLALSFIPNPQNKPFINHIDGNKKNNQLDNLEWCTALENARHASRTGLLPRGLIGPGEKSHAAKLTDEYVLEIRAKLRIGARHVELAREYGVVKGTIGHIHRRATWAHI